jgi:hypothetical protein
MIRGATMQVKIQKLMRAQDSKLRLSKILSVPHTHLLATQWSWVSKIKIKSHVSCFQG